MVIIKNKSPQSLEAQSMMAENQEDNTPLKESINERKRVSSIRVLYLTVAFSMLGKKFQKVDRWLRKRLI